MTLHDFLRIAAFIMAVLSGLAFSGAFFSDAARLKISVRLVSAFFVLASLVTIATVVTGCASAKPPVTTPETDQDRCVGLIDTVCTRVEECGYAARDACLAEQIGGCSQPVVVSEPRYAGCVRALQEFPCQGRGFPPACFDVLKIRTEGLDEPSAREL